MAKPTGHILYCSIAYRANLFHHSIFNSNTQYLIRVSILNFILVMLGLLYSGISFNLTTHIQEKQECSHLGIGKIANLFLRVFLSWRG